MLHLGGQRKCAQQWAEQRHMEMQVAMWGMAVHVWKDRPMELAWLAHRRVSDTAALTLQLP